MDETFNQCLNLFAKRLAESYTITESGEKITEELPEEQLANIANIIDISQRQVSDCFKPLFDSYMNRIKANSKKIDELIAATNTNK